MLSDEQVAELRRLEKAATPGKWRACPVNREKMGVCPCVSVFQEEGGIVLSASLDGCGDPEMTFDKTTMEYRKEMAANLDLVAALRNAAPALLSAHADAVRLREKMDRVRMFLQWMADYEKSPPEIVKDDFAYDRLMSWMKRSCGEWASKCEAALRHAEQGGA